MRLASLLLDLIAPIECGLCGHASGPSRDVPFCSACARGLPWWRLADGCPLCGTWTPLPGAPPEPGLFSGGAEGCPGCLANGSPLHACHALLRYEGPVRFWIPGFKRTQGPFGPPPSLARTIAFLADELARMIERAASRTPDEIIPVPPHPRRRRERGFDHAAWLARRIARQSGRPCRAGGLIRVHATRSQAGLRGSARRGNVRGAFRTSAPLAPGARVWLVDDVLTTGHTLEAAAEALLAGGADEVHGLALAATLPARRRARRAPAPTAP